MDRRKYEALSDAQLINVIRGGSSQERALATLILRQRGFTAGEIKSAAGAQAGDPTDHVNRRRAARQAQYADSNLRTDRAPAPDPAPPTGLATPSGATRDDIGAPPLPPPFADFKTQPERPWSDRYRDPAPRPPSTATADRRDRRGQAGNLPALPSLTMEDPAPPSGLATPGSATRFGAGLTPPAAPGYRPGPRPPISGQNDRRPSAPYDANEFMGTPTRIPVPYDPNEFEGTPITEPGVGLADVIVPKPRPPAAASRGNPSPGLDAPVDPADGVAPPEPRPPSLAERLLASPEVDTAGIEVEQDKGITLPENWWKYALAAGSKMMSPGQRANGTGKTFFEALGDGLGEASTMIEKDDQRAARKQERAEDRAFRAAEREEDRKFRAEISKLDRDSREKVARERNSKESFSSVILQNGNIGAFNHRTAKVTDTGVRARDLAGKDGKVNASRISILLEKATKAVREDIDNGYIEPPDGVQHSVFVAEEANRRVQAQVSMANELAGSGAAPSGGPTADPLGIR
ncbi:MAG: hypothetical protein NXI16_01190 [Alphaproteobacteria bacterium]|nr:hypothetical protein [Alphaproteobacteria bacterium]